jgi:hypothetical protein
MRKIILLLALLSALATPAFAGLNVVATLPWIGSAAKEIGKDRINVTVLIKPGQDAHMIEAKPSMILAARKADIIMYDGLDLEIGYLPLIIESSKNLMRTRGMPVTTRRTIRLLPNGCMRRKNSGARCRFRGRSSLPITSILNTYPLNTGSRSSATSSRNPAFRRPQATLKA